MTGTASAPTFRDVLTQTEAEDRASRVRDVRYTLAIDIQPQASTYRGTLAVDFRSAVDGPVFLDFRGRDILRLTVNGVDLEPDRRGYRIYLPEEALGSENTVEIEYENEYDRTGDGFHQFIDPEDGKEYLYTNFEPFEAHRLFPCFDQPDIKARYRLTVRVPSEWEVIANSRAVRREPQADGRTVWEFAETPPFSTYLFALVAGPYRVVRDRHGDLELGLYVRESLLKYLDHDEVFEVTKQGFDFYTDFFGYPYPFDKYDQIFVPEFNAGAMENVGAVTHNEYMVFRDPPTESQRRGRAETILHELAHMWFGNLVTMRWWNDLWLNESFATFMAYLALERATRFKTAWQDFNATIKNWAYRQDQLPTTHPIAGEVRDTEETFLNFDGITYGKGASVLKQLAAYIGLDAFREGLRHYFRQYEWGNATLRQFLAALEAGSGRDLKAWAHLWLETPSLNTLSVHWEPDDGRIGRLEVRQTAPPEFPTLRPHRLDIGLFRRTRDGYEVTVVPAEIDGERAELAEAAGLPKPDFVLPNYNDLAYAKIALDPASLEHVLRHIGDVDDTLSRQLLWSALWNMTRDAQLSPLRFIRLVLDEAPREPLPELADSILNQALAALGRYVPDRLRLEEAHRFFERAWQALHDAPPGDQKIIWGRALVAAASTPDDLHRLAELADGKHTIEGFTLDQEMRWTFVTKWMAHGLPGADDHLEAELQRDPSDRGQRARLRTLVSRPDAAVKAEAWEKFQGDGYGSLYLTVAAMSGFNWWHQRELLEPYVERFFGAVRGIFETKTLEYARAYFQQLFPAYRVEDGVAERAKALLAEVPESMPPLRRLLHEAIDEAERALRCRAAAQ